MATRWVGKNVTSVDSLDRKWECFNIPRTGDNTIQVTNNTAEAPYISPSVLDEYLPPTSHLLIRHFENKTFDLSQFGWLELKRMCFFYYHIWWMLCPVGFKSFLVVHRNEEATIYFHDFRNLTFPSILPLTCAESFFFSWECILVWLKDVFKFI